MSWTVGSSEVKRLLLLQLPKAVLLAWAQMLAGVVINQVMEIQDLETAITTGIGSHIRAGAVIHRMVSTEIIHHLLLMVCRQEEAVGQHGNETTAEMIEGTIDEMIGLSLECRQRSDCLLDHLWHSTQIS